LYIYKCILLLRSFKFNSIVRKQQKISVLSDHFNLAFFNFYLENVSSKVYTTKLM
jgi:hypothetical protein